MKAKEMRGSVKGFSMCPSEITEARGGETARGGRRARPAPPAPRRSRRSCPPSSFQPKQSARPPGAEAGHRGDENQVIKSALHLELFPENDRVNNGRPLRLHDDRFPKQEQISKNICCQRPGIPLHILGNAPMSARVNCFCPLKNAEYITTKTSLEEYNDEN